MHKYKQLNSSDIEQLIVNIDRKLSQDLAKETIVWSLELDGYDPKVVGEIVEARLLWHEAQEKEGYTGLLSRYVYWFYHYFRDPKFWIVVVLVVICLLFLGWRWYESHLMPIIDRISGAQQRDLERPIPKPINVSNTLP